MCNTDEHIDIGDMAQLAVPRFLLETGFGKGKGSGSYTRFLNWWKDHNKSKDDNECFTLHNGATVSYGDILGMTGDFYANYQEMESNENSSWDHNVKRDEIKMITSLYRKMGKDPTAHETPLSGDEPEQGDFFSHVALLATTNFPHFAPDSISTWLTWHRKAIDIARLGRDAVQTGQLARYTDLFVSQDGSPDRDPSVPPEWALNSADFVLADSLCRALKYNAFADHFLSDMWAAGHMRVMRRLHKGYFDRSFIDLSAVAQVVLKHASLDLGLAQEVPDRVRKVVGGPSRERLEKYRNKVQQVLLEMFNYPGIDLGDITSGIHHDEDGNRGLWYRLLLGDLTLPGLGIDQDDFVGPVGDVFALGDGTFYDKLRAVPPGGNIGKDGGDLYERNFRNRRICYTAIRLSVRDICLASALGSEFETYRKSQAYWKVLGDDVGPRPLYAALRLYPKPNAPDGKFVRSYKGREANKSNHYPLVAPGGDVGKLEARYDVFKKMIMQGKETRLDEQCWLRKIQPVRFDPVTIKGLVIQPPDLQVPGTRVTPSISATDDYWDIKANWADGSTPIDRLTDAQLNIDRIPIPPFPESFKNKAIATRKDLRETIRKGWRYMEIGRIIKQYADLKFSSGQHYDCDEP